MNIIEWAFMPSCGTIGMVYSGKLTWYATKFLNGHPSNTWVLLHRLPADTWLHTLEKLDGTGSRFHLDMRDSNERPPLRSRNVVSLVAGFGSPWVGDAVKPLRFNSTLTKLDLTHVKDCATLLQWQEALKMNSSVTVLNLSGLTQKCTAENVSSLYLAKSITCLNLRDCRVGEDGAKSLLQLDTLTDLDIANNGIRDAGMLALSTHSSLRHLCASANDITDRGLAMLESNTTITKLYIAENNITHDGIIPLSKSKSIKTLYLAACEIYDQGVVHLAKNTTITSLTLDSTRVGDGVIALAKHTSLTKLHIYDVHNLIGPDAVKTLLSNTSLRKLCIESEKPRKGVWRNARVEKLHCNSGTIDTTTMRDIVSNTSLTYLAADNVGAGALEILAQTEHVREAQFEDMYISEADASALLRNATLCSLEMTYLYTTLPALRILSGCPQIMKVECLQCRETAQKHNGMGTEGENGEECYLVAEEETEGFRKERDAAEFALCERIIRNTRRVRDMPRIFMMKVATIFRLFRAKRMCLIQR